MITAREAQELVEQSDTNIKKILDILDPKIRQAASEGKRSFYPYHGTVFDLVNNGFPQMTTFQRRLADELAKFGFTMSIDSYEFRGGIGTWEEDDTRDKLSHALIIRW